MHARSNTSIIALAVASTLALVSPTAFGVLSTFGGAASNINTYLGANTFYAAGFTGTNAIAANVEGQYAGNTHLTETSLTTYFKDPSAVGTLGAHPTWVVGMIGGRPVTAEPEKGRGIAYGATLWSGAIATSVSGNSFTISAASLVSPYATAMQTGVGGKKANVINSSWGNSGDLGGTGYINQVVDALAAANGTTVCVSAGNSGSGTNTVGSPGSGYNTLTVGALDGSTYNTIASFSSRGASDYTNPITGATIAGIRATVHISAPGTSLYGAQLGSTTAYDSGLAGTSFASPITAGGASLVVDAGKTLFPSNAKAVDGRVVKAVLMNSATKTSGWTNAQSVVSGVITTTRGLDYTYGAGRLNLAQAYPQYTAGTTDVAGLGGGNVLATGWDYGNVAQNAPTDYIITQPLLGGSTFTATLDWFIAASLNTSTLAASDDSFDNLDLQIWSTTGSALTSLVAQSTSLYNTAEHLNFAIPTTGFYAIRVVWAGENYDRFNDANNSDFGLAWNGTFTVVPEPAAMALPLVAFGTLLTRRRSVR